MTGKLILTGFMATGKSSVGPIVARRLGWEFIDSDTEIAKRAGKPVAQIFSDHGEAHFRRLERQVIAELAQNGAECPKCHGPRHQVISTGGGALMDEANCAALKSAGVIVCLAAAPETIAARVARSKGARPKLLEGGKPMLERVRELMAERASAYTRADIVIDTSDLTTRQVADRVIEFLSERAASLCVKSA